MTQYIDVSLQEAMNRIAVIRSMTHTKKPTYSKDKGYHTEQKMTFKETVNNNKLN